MCITAGKMKVFVLLLMLCGVCFTKKLISEDEVGDLFKKFVKGNLTEPENRLFEEVIDVLRRQERASARALDTYGQARSTLDFVICRSLFAAGFEAAKEGQSYEQLGASITTLCSVIGIESYAVCEGAVGLNVPIIHYIAINAPAATPAALCGLLEQNAHNPNQNLWPVDERFEWEVELPPVPTHRPVLKRDEKPLTVAVMTDFHIDPLYEAFGQADCDEPTCCRIGQRPAAKQFTFDDEPLLNRTIVKDGKTVKLDLNMAPALRKMRSIARSRSSTARQSEPAGYWGDFRNCDTPLWAFDDAIDRIAETHKDIDVVYYIGDTIDHFVWETTYELINDVNRYAMNKLRSSFGDHVPILPVIGNHESQPTNQFAPASVIGEKVNTTWLYEALASKWSYYLPKDAQDTFRERGEFSMLVRPGLRVITLNNNVAYKFNWWLVFDPLDAKKHLDWLVVELYKAELAGENVHILAHIPPGVPDLTYTWTREYNRIINRFSPIIKAEFNGHTHSDEFKLFYNTEGQPNHVAWGAGSVTTHSFYNLNYKIVTFDGDKYEPQSISNYVYNLTEANLTPNRRPHWYQLYDMKNTFNLPDLSPTSINDLIHRMVTTDRNLLDIYSALFSKLSESRMSWCHDDCKIDMICKIVVTVLWERQRCEELTRVFYLNRIKGK